MKAAALGLGMVAIAATFAMSQANAERAVPIPAARADVAPAPGLQSAIFAGGCFWGMEAVFEHVKGVRSVTAGYAGGTRATASYAQVSTETTRHAEAIRIAYDPRQVSYATLLRVYFSVAHDPTQVNGQMPDMGPSYRSAIFAQSPEQARVARAYIAQLDATRAFRKPIATKLEQGQFFPAEAYHQDFFDRNPDHPYIRMWDKPKLAAFRAGFPSLAR
ncbi:peptide-methionine (S)-S-oxide reductase MsrA [Microvirga sp. SRT01]|jgi:peptide-methionine (S)-S-oxide reductase|uniref:Peptide methionine sulfoxide reductase MsrA n=2 Tax=Sphingomonas longa TaxID=2778730 RepID=A0ABS2D669_9SPHN|nr:peptide-methionine (S)-S-oxide reductase MsrA [Microvirga sp. SRT01]MBM6576417.1 peptide-methionine (S)-S-oxide reductase MsrA [Sphingomonas sp. BT552]MBR7709463.1 peptide-methionine (S)-S-oxide reductase MsrA [Microvirga sp. SRT01]